MLSYSRWAWPGMFISWKSPVLPWNDWDIYSAVSGKERIRDGQRPSDTVLGTSHVWGRRWKSIWPLSPAKTDLGERDPVSSRPEANIPMCMGKKIPTTSRKISTQKREIRVQWFLHGSPSAQVQPGSTVPSPTACQSCQDSQGQEAHLPSPHLPQRDRQLQHCCPVQLLGRDLILLQPFLLLSLKEKGLSQTSLQKVMQEGGEPPSFLGREGEKGGSRARNQWRLGKTLADRPQGFELYQFPWNLDAAKNTWATPVRAMFCLSVAASVTSKGFDIIGMEKWIE